MTYKICLQAGHVNKAGSGAPNEQATNKRITDRLSDMLRKRGFQVKQTDWYANNDPVVTGNDYHLFLALHCDMDYPNDGGSGFVDFAEPSTDSATAESQRIAKVIKEVYFPEVKINYVSHSNANTRYYYMWKYLTPKTPCVLIEMGQSIDPHDSVLLGNTDLIAGALCKSICKAFNVTYEIVPPVVVIEDPHTSEISSLKKEISDLKKTQEQLKAENQSKLAVKDKDCQEKILSYKEKIINFINSL